MKKAIRKIAVLAMLLVMMLSVCVPASAAEKVVTVGTTAAWNTLCFLSNQNESHMVFSYPMFDQWVNYTSTGEIQPRFFESWELQEDGKTMIVKCRENAFFHDGVQVTAHDVVFTETLRSAAEFDNAMNANTKYLVGTDSSGKRIEGEYFGMEALDDFTLKITIKDATDVTNYFYQFRGTMILPKHILGDVPAAEVATHEFWQHPIGSGAFQFDSYIDGERIEYVTNKNYYLGAADFDRMIIRVIPEANMLSAMMAGEVDITARGSQLSMGDYQLAELDPNLATYAAKGFNNYHILINNKTVEQPVRVAMDHAIDKQSIINDLLYGYARVAISAIVPENPYRKEGIEGNAFDPDAAKQILADAGWDGSRELVMIVNSSAQLNNNIAILVQQHLASVGIKVSIQSFDGTTINSKLFSGDYDLAVMSSASNAFEPSESLWYFNDGGWLQHTRENGYLEIYENGLAGTTHEERSVWYDKLQEKLVEDVPMIFLFHQDKLFVHTQRMSNMVFENFDISCWNWWDWKVAE